MIKNNFGSISGVSSGIESGYWWPGQRRIL